MLYKLDDLVNQMLGINQDEEVKAELKASPAKRGRPSARGKSKGLFISAKHNVTHVPRQAFMTPELAAKLKKPESDLDSDSDSSDSSDSSTVGLSANDVALKRLKDRAKQDAEIAKSKAPEPSPTKQSGLYMFMKPKSSEQTKIVCQGDSSTATNMAEMNPIEQSDQQKASRIPSIFGSKDKPTSNAQPAPPTKTT